MSIAARVEKFCSTYRLLVPIMLAPMSGVPAPELSIAVAGAGGMGALGALQMHPAEIQAWVETVRAGGCDNFQINLWTPDPPPKRNAAREAEAADLIGKFGQRPGADAGNAVPPDFQKQLEATLEMSPPAVSSVMGLFPPEFVKELKARNILWIATATTLREALDAEDAGADIIAAQGMEAGGHRGAFESANAERELVGLFSLLPAIVNKVSLPVVAAGGIADGRGVAAALALGASAVAIGTGFLRCPEAQISKAWADRIGETAPEDTAITRAFSGRAGRGIATKFVRAMMEEGAPPAAPYPVQRGLTAAMRAEATTNNNVENMQAWAGQSAAMAQAMPAAEVVRTIWQEACAIFDETSLSG